MIFVLLTPFAVYGLVRAGAWAANQWLLPSLFGQSGHEGAQDVIDGRTAHTMGIALAAVATLREANRAWGARRTTESWRKGAQGEVMTAKALERLPYGYNVLHDLRMPGSRANIDHVVLGPTGVFTVETKNYSSDVIVRRGAARRAGRSMDGVVQQAFRQAEALGAASGRDVRAVVCVQGAHVRLEGWFSKPTVDGVLFCSGRKLVRVITRGSRELSQEEVSRLTATVEQRFGRSASSRTPVSVDDATLCDCGGRMVLRRRRGDGAPFWGCSRYPSCRRTVPT